MRGTDGSAEITSVPRPSGELLWIHLSDVARVGVLGQIAAKLTLQRQDFCILITAPSDTPPEQLNLPQNAIWQPLSGAHTARAAQFLAHWRPDAALWIGGQGDPDMMRALKGRGIPVMLVEADRTASRPPGVGWRRDRGRINWDVLTHIHARSATAARDLERLGAPAARTKVSGLLQDAPVLPDCNEPDREALMASLAGRPVWLADGVPPDEDSLILETHSQARRAAQRLMLVIRPDRPERVPALVRHLRENTRFIVADWTAGDWPERQTDIVVTDGVGEAGLWVRVASLFFAGGTLASAGTEVGDPRIAAALGSVVLYGPVPNRFSASFDQLADAGAVRSVRDAIGLARALQQLLAPDRAAAMALAAWETLSEGAEFTDRLIDEIGEMLDQAAEGEQG